MKLKIYQVDAFTQTVFKGNYAAVIILEEWLEKELMQEIAAENNLSETAFAKKCGSNRYEIRWFSPLCEIDFCGHATLATAFVLFREDNTLDELIFSADAVGELNICQNSDAEIVMTFPNRKPTLIKDIPKEIIKGLSIKPKEVLRNQQAYYVVLPKEEDIYNIEVDFQELKKLAPYDVAITASSAKYDFISRYFWPSSGGDEDPVTGSIHTALAPYWAQELGKNELVAYQASKRGGLLNCEVRQEKVVISGKAVLYLEGYIYV